MAAAVAVEAERDPVAVRAAQILVSLRFRKLRERPEWLPALAAGEPSSSASLLEVPVGWAGRRPRSRGGLRGSPAPWRKALREMGLAAAAAGGSGGDERERAAPAEAAPAPGSGSPPTSSAARAARHAGAKAQAAAAPAPAQEPMKASSPVTPLDYGAGGSGASSSADDAARPRAKRGPPGARGSGGGAAASCADDDEGCSSPAKRARLGAPDDGEPIPTVRAQFLSSVGV